MHIEAEDGREVAQVNAECGAGGPAVGVMVPADNLDSYTAMDCSTAEQFGIQLIAAAERAQSMQVSYDDDGSEEASA